jgi:hypothetical protein
MVGRKIANYTVKRLIGEGCTGSVYEAVQEPTGRRVAIKVLRADCTTDPSRLKRFFNELRTAPVPGQSPPTRTLGNRQGRRFLGLPTVSAPRKKIGTLAVGGASKCGQSSVPDP